MVLQFLMLLFFVIWDSSFELLFAELIEMVEYVEEDVVVEVILLFLYCYRLFYLKEANVSLLCSCKRDDN